MTPKIEMKKFDTKSCVLFLPLLAADTRKRIKIFICVVPIQVVIAILKSMISKVASLLLAKCHLDVNISFDLPEIVVDLTT